MAVEKGYFSIPRETELGEIADVVGKKTRLILPSFCTVRRFPGWPTPDSSSTTRGVKQPDTLIRSIVTFYRYFADRSDEIRK